MLVVPRPYNIGRSDGSTATSIGQSIVSPDGHVINRPHVTDSHPSIADLVAGMPLALAGIYDA